MRSYRTLRWFPGGFVLRTAVDTGMAVANRASVAVARPAPLDHNPDDNPYRCPRSVLRWVAPDLPGLGDNAGCRA